MGVNSLVLFLGPVRTGHTLIASLLSSHKNISISLEYNVPKRLFIDNMPIDMIFDEILNIGKNRTNLEKGGYDYTIKSSYQRDISKVKVIGDSMTGYKYMKFLNTKNITHLIDRVTIPIKWILVYRNPYDIIQSSSNMNKKGIGYNLDIFKKNMEFIRNLTKNKIVSTNLFKLYIEDLIFNPDENLRSLLNFLDVPCYKYYLEMCFDNIFKKPHRAFVKKDWTSDQLSSVYSSIKEITDLGKYKDEF